MSTERITGPAVDEVRLPRGGLAAAWRSADLAEITLTACGFALGFGWLWFPFLAAHWLPAFLWGRPFAGGGASLFIAVLVIGFLLYGLTISRKPEPEPLAPKPPDRKPGPVGPHLAHALALAGAPLELSSAWLSWGLPCELRVSALALAGLAMGLFWGGRLLSLAPAQAGWALAGAGAVSALLALMLAIGPVSGSNAGLALALGLAWLAAWRLDRLKRPRPEAKRPRGRPPKKAAPAEARPDSAGRLSKSDLGLMVAAIFLAGLVEAGPDLSSPTWLAQTIALAGVVGAMALFRLVAPRWAETQASPAPRAEDPAERPDDKAVRPGRRKPPGGDDGETRGLMQELNPQRPQILLCSILALLGAGQLLAPGLFFLPAKFLMGGIWLILTLLLAGAPPRAARRRAAVALALTLMLSNAGPEMVAWLAGLLSAGSISPLISDPATRLVGLLTLAAALIFRALAAPAGCARPSAASLFEPRLGDLAAEGEALAIAKEFTVTSAVERRLDQACSPGNSLDRLPGSEAQGRPGLLNRRPEAGDQPDEGEPPAGEPAAPSLPLSRAGESGPAGSTLEAVRFELTSREEEIMGLAVRGCGNRQIADRLSIQEATVRFHLRNIYKKTGLNNRRELLALAGRLEREQNSV